MVGAEELQHTKNIHGINYLWINVTDPFTLHTMSQWSKHDWKFETKSTKKLDRSLTLINQTDEQLMMSESGKADCIQLTIDYCWINKDWQP